VEVGFLGRWEKKCYLVLPNLLSNNRRWEGLGSMRFLLFFGVWRGDSSL
jgi:hypothetical protein